MNYQKSYYPKRPVKSFQDLEVYQKLLAVCVAVVKNLTADKPKGGEDGDLAGKLKECVLSLPRFVAMAHSLRFADSQKAVETLEEAMLNCNLAVVYLEQYRDIYNTTIEADFFEEQIKTLLSTRMKVMRLQMSWKKFMKEKEE